MGLDGDAYDEYAASDNVRALWTEPTQISVTGQGQIGEQGTFFRFMGEYTIHIWIRLECKKWQARRAEAAERSSMRRCSITLEMRSNKTSRESASWPRTRTLRQVKHELERSPSLTGHTAPFTTTWYKDCLRHTEEMLPQYQSMVFGMSSKMSPPYCTKPSHAVVQDCLAK